MQATGFFVALTCLALTRLSESASDCYPSPEQGKTHYLVGYGSLINAESKNRTSPETGVNIPVTISGFKRTWTARGYSNVSMSTTYLGVQEDKKSSLNGVIFSVPSSDSLTKYDGREKFYCRVKIPYTDVHVLRGAISDNGTFPSDDDLKISEFWIYVNMPKYSEYPNEEYPIVQSYVDIFLSGCIQMERKYGLTGYADDCVTKTYGWDNPWDNDRVHPRRPFAYQAYAGAIDHLLVRHIKNYPKNVNIMGNKEHQSRDVSAGSQLIGNGLKTLGYALLITLIARL